MTATDVGTLVAAIASVVAAVATSVASFFAWRAAKATEKGAEAWRHQLREQSRHEAARKLLTAVYQLQSAVESARLPFRFGGDGPAPLNPLKADAVHSRNVAAAEGAARRMEPVVQARAQLLVDLQAAKVVLGDLATEAVTPLLKATGELLAAVSNLGMYAGLSSERRPHADELAEQRRILTDLHTPSIADEFGARFAETVSSAEGALTPMTRQPAEPEARPKKANAPVGE